MKHRRLHPFCVVQPALAAATLLCLSLVGLPVAASPPNQPPELTPISDRTINEGSLLVFNASATDPDVPTQALTFTLDSGVPEGAAISASGVFTWTPAEAQGPGAYPLRVIVTDSGSPILTATQSFNVTVQEINRAPVLDPIPDRIVNEGELLTFTASATDPDLPAQTLTFTLGGSPPVGTSINPVTGVFTWTPSEAQGPNSYFISVFVTDNGTPTQNDARGFTVTVREVNRPPELPVIADITANEGTFVFFSALPTDPDIPAQTVTVTLGPGAPAGAAISTGGFFTWSPGEGQGPSTNRITLIATDNGTPGLISTQLVNVIILEVNQAPTLNFIADQTVNEGEPLTFPAVAADGDLPAQTLTFTLGAGAPAGATVDAVTGAFAWTPTEAQGPGTYGLSVVVTDNATPNQSASRSFTVTVQEVNRPPTLSALEDRVVAEGSLLSFNVAAADPDIPTQTLVFTLGPGSPTGAAIDANTGQFTWTPTGNQGPSTNRIFVIVADNGTPSLTATQVFTAIVTDLNGAPTLAAIPDQVIDEGQLLTFTASATDPDQPGQTLTFSLGGGAPAGAVIDSNTGAFTWTPAENQGPATNVITVNVADSGTPPLTASRSFTIVVHEVNRPPVVGALEDRAINSGALMTFNASASDPDIPTQTLTFTLGPGTPTGAAISASGLFTWTPTGAQSPSTNVIAVIVADNGAPSLTATQRFTAIVTDLNRAPNLAVIPDQTVNEGQLLALTAVATDSDIPTQTITFKLGAGAADGAAIDPNTGVFTWTPAENQGPATNVITVLAADSGTPPLSASRTFSVIVNEVNRRPEIDPIADQNVNAGGLLVFGVAFRDPDIPVQPLTVTLAPGTPVGAEISAGGLFTWTPTAAQAPSTNTICVIASDNGAPSLMATQCFIVRVQGVNHDPSLAAIPDQTVNEGELLSLTASATDPDLPLQTLAYSLGAGAPTGVAIDPNTGVLTWTPAENQGPATNIITVVVADNGTPTKSAFRSFSVVVNEVNQPPVINPIADQTVTVGTFVVFGVAFSDPDIPTQTLTATLGSGAPAGAAVSAGGLFTWTPTAEQSPSTNRIAVIVTENVPPRASATQFCTITVVGVNRAPSLATIHDQTVNEGVLLTFTVSATDPDLPPQTLTFSLGAGTPDGAAIDASTGVFTWTPAEVDGPATNILTVVVTDNGTPVQSAFRSFSVAVNEINRPPELDPIADRVATVGSFLVFGVTFRDPDIPFQVLTATLGPGAPEGAAISPGGLFTWTPTAGQASSINPISVIVSDNAVPSLTATQRFTITVGSFNRPPALEAIPDQTVNEGQPLTFTINASDPDQPFQSLTYALGSGTPAGASLNPATGVFTWTPNEFQGPETNILSLVVTDNGVPPMAVFGNVRIVVNEVNQPPFFLPETNFIVNVGSPLIFSVEADDLDIPQTLLTYSLAPGSPGGASITPRGEFSWRPAAGQGPSNYFVSVIVTDGGVPPLKATNVIEINVIVGAPLTPPVLREPAWRPNNAFTTSIDMIAGRRYSLEGSDAADPSSWRTVEAFQGRGAVDIMTDRNATNRNRIYRARVE